MNAKLIITAALLATGGVAAAQGSGLAAALAAGQVGEQADGFLGVRGTVSAGVRAELENINIKRRAYCWPASGSLLRPQLCLLLVLSVSRRVV